MANRFPAASRAVFGGCAGKRGRVQKPKSTRHHTTALRGIVCIGALTFSMACHRPPAIPDYERTLTAFGAPPITDPRPTVTEANVFLNLGQPMRGFTVQGSNFRRVVEALLSETPAQQYTVQKFRFAGNVSPADSYTAANFLDPSNYTGQPATLGQLLEQLVRQRLFERVNIIVTDLVDPDGATGRPGIASALRELASKKVEVMLLGFRSAYLGDYQAAATTCANRRIALRASQSLPGSGRPFYVLVIAPNAGSMNRLYRAVLEKLRAAVSFTPSGNPISLEAGALGQQPSISILDRTQRKREYGTTRRFYSSFAVPAGGSTDIKLPFKWTATRAFDIDPAKLSFDVTGVRVDASGKFAPSTSDPLSVKAADDPQSPAGSVLVEYTVRPPEGTSFVVFRVQMRAGVGNLSAPRWVKDWSTDDDCAPPAASRTYRLDVVGDTLMSNFAQDTVFAEHYIALRRK